MMHPVLLCFSLLNNPPKKPSGKVKKAQRKRKKASGNEKSPAENYCKADVRNMEVVSGIFPYPISSIPDHGSEYFRILIILILLLIKKKK